MCDINPETHRHHLAEIERQLNPGSRPFFKMADRTTISERMRNVPAALIAVLLIVGFAGGSML